MNLDSRNVTSHKDYSELYKNLSNGFPVALVMGVIQMRTLPFQFKISFKGGKLSNQLLMSNYNSVSNLNFLHALF